MDHTHNDESQSTPKMDIEEIIELGNEFIDAGIEVFPIALAKTPTKVEKRPLTRHGHNSAVLDKSRWEQLVRHSQGHLRDGEEMGVGGHLTQHVMFDFDEKNGARGAEVRERLTALYGEEMGAVAFTSVSGATNWLLRKPENVEIGNTSPWTEYGVDIRADNGWFVVPGTKCSWGSWEWSNGELDDLDSYVVPTEVWAKLKKAGQFEGRVARDAEIEQWLDANKLTAITSSVAQAQLQDHIHAIRTASNRHPAMWDALVWIRHQGSDIDRREAFEAIDTAWRVRMAADGEHSRVGECEEKLAHLVGASLEWEKARDAHILEAQAPAEFTTQEGEDTQTDPAAFLRGRLLDVEGLKAIPMPEPVVAGHLMRDSIAWIIGKPGVGKSFVALDLALRVATGGGDWYGHRVEGGKVLYVAAEGASGMSMRVEAWRRHHQPEQPLDIHFLPFAVSVFDAQWTDALADVVEFEGYDLIIIDTLARSSLGAEENSAKDAGVIVSNLDRLRVAAQGACVTLIHHTGKDAGQGGRGSSAFLGALESEITVTGSIEGGVKVEVTKQKNFAEPPAKTFRAVTVELPNPGPDEFTARRLGLGAEDLEPLTSVVLVPGEIDDEEPEEREGASVKAHHHSVAVRRVLDKIGSPASGYEIKSRLAANDYSIGDGTLKGILESLAHQGFVAESKGPRGSRLWALTALGYESLNGGDPSA